MKTIHLNQPAGTKFGPQLLELIRILEALSTGTDDHHIVFDFSKVKFVRPLFALTLAGLAYRLGKEGYTISLTNASNEYLNLIHFPGGLQPDKTEDWENLLTKYAGKTYFPILNFPTSKTEAAIRIRNNSLSCLNMIIQKKLSLDSNIYNAVSYLVSEMTDNITDHSGEERGWLFAQYYPEDKFIDICILDTGKTILKSYRDNGFDQIRTHSDAIYNATQGLSTKDKERGRGIPTTRRLIVNGMKGKFGMVSGNAILQNESIVELPVTWQGTFLALRIPQNPPDFNFYNYLE